MMRAVEAVLAIAILLTAVIVAGVYVRVPQPAEVSTPLLDQLRYTILQTLSTGGFLARAAFSDNDVDWNELQNVVSALLPSNVVYNLTVYKTNETDAVTHYVKFRTITNFQGSSPIRRTSASIMVASPGLTYQVSAQKINVTLYILNCSDGNSWWITGYTAQRFAATFKETLSPYFRAVVMVNSTAELDLLLQNRTISGDPNERIQDGVVLNTFGEAVPIPSDTTRYPLDNDNYTYKLGQKVGAYNWTWVSVVGYPLFYLTNTVRLAGSENTYGIYGMRNIGPTGLNAFLKGLDDQSYVTNGTWITEELGVVTLTGPTDPRDQANATFHATMYGVYIQPYQTSTRAMPQEVLGKYHLRIDPRYGYIFQPIRLNQLYFAGANLLHIGGDGKTHGVLTALGLTRTPDPRVTTLALLMHYHPILYGSSYSASDTTRIVVFELAQQGGE